MDAQWKAKWVAALRSGEYEQGRMYLKRDDKFCCLGVLCDLVARDGLTQWEYNAAQERHEIAGEWDYLPHKIQDATGLDEINPLVAFNDRYVSLAFLNDEKRQSFLEIADLIEKYL
jgi:hypothetical protein